MRWHIIWKGVCAWAQWSLATYDKIWYERLGVIVAIISLSLSLLRKCRSHTRGYHFYCAVVDATRGDKSSIRTQKFSWKSRTTAMLNRSESQRLRHFELFACDWIRRVARIQISHHHRKTVSLWVIPNSYPINAITWFTFLSRVTSSNLRGFPAFSKIHSISRNCVSRFSVDCAL